MSGTCGDYSAAPRLGEGACLSTKIGGETFSVIKKGSYTGLVTYPDGRVVRLAPDAEPKPVSGRKGVLYVEVFASADSDEKTVSIDITKAQLDLIQSMQPDPTRPPAEIGVCYNNGGSFQVQPLSLKAGKWTPLHQIGIQRLFGDETDRVFMCVDGKPGEIGINTSSGTGLVVGEAGDALRKDGLSALGSGFDEAHYKVLLNAFNRMSPATIDPHHRPISWFDWLLFGVFAYHPVVDIIKAIRGRGKEEATDTSDVKTKPISAITGEKSYDRFLSEIGIDKNEWEHAKTAGTEASLISEKLRDPDCTAHPALAKTLYLAESWLEEKNPYAHPEEFRRDLIQAYVSGLRTSTAAEATKMIESAMSKHLDASKLGDAELKKARDIVERVEKAAAKEREAREEKEKKGI